MECSRMRCQRTSRVSCGSSLESRSPRMRYSGSRMTAPATTGPKSDPRPTSSTPAMSFAPEDQASFSYLVVQWSLLSRRSFRADLERDFSPLFLDFAFLVELLGTERYLKWRCR